MSGRSAKQAVTVVVATVVCATVLAAGVISGPAGASTLTSADGFTTLTTQGAVTAETPYSGGQTVDLQVAANSTMDTASLEAAGFPSGAVTIKFLECADPGGLVANLPTKPSECEPGTIHSISGANADGSMSLTGASGYQILALPDPNLGSSNGTTCGLAPDQCVVGIFSNQNDFSKPHLFSAPFVATLGDGLDDGANPGDGTPPPAPAVTSVSPTSGPTGGGTTVTIDGTALSGTTGVTFGTASATDVVNVSSTEVTAVSPAGSAGAVDVTVTTPNGTSTTGPSDRFTYVAAPTVTSISPTSGPTTGGTGVTITGTGLTGATAVKFGTRRPPTWSTCPPPR